ncbi:protein arginine kinase [Clostridium frigidicarnis]|uniref:Protein-arginine kinase n=1 Tax=Clostridium frigidicarnis TaxID=84698 RepID=A0A1I1AEX1_9CLOT|nr:protein arginine kinase [Clostridium frigidicarnis]SFB34893.1 protein arginine kinase [Clostridium frigidicarnis]
MNNWINGNTDSNNIVLSSRVRIARNLDKVPFPHKLSEDESKDVISKVQDGFFKAIKDKESFGLISLDEISKDEVQYYVEKHVISKKLSENKNGAFILNKDETLSIMINEEDHLRIQSITSGLNIKEAYDEANKIDDFLEQNLNYGFDEEIGYVTACPTNLGTGLRASAMLHLPAITLNNEMNGVLKALTQMGMTIRGIYGEGSKAEGNIYQVSNQITLGISEEEIIRNLQGTVSQIVNQEIKTRELVNNKFKYELEDKIFRSLAILKNSRLLSIEEGLELLSNVRLGVEMGIIENITQKFLNELLVDCQPSSLKRILCKDLSNNEINFQRAKLVRERFN